MIKPWALVVAHFVRTRREEAFQRSPDLDTLYVRTADCLFLPVRPMGCPSRKMGTEVLRRSRSTGTRTSLTGMGLSSFLILDGQSQRLPAYERSCGGALPQIRSLQLGRGPSGGRHTPTSEAFRSDLWACRPGTNLSCRGSLPITLSFLKEAGHPQLVLWSSKRCRVMGLGCSASSSISASSPSVISRQR